MSIKRNSQLEHLILLEKLGTGGQGEVWSAYDQDKDRVVAAKLLPESPEHRSDVSQELDKEFYLLASISHPHILPLFELYLTAEWQYYTMHYCPAGSLRDWLRTAEPTWDAVIAMAAQIASALDYLHDLHIVHRDLKPSNILRDMDDCLFLTDFGLATMIGRAQTDVVHTGRGTIPYAPPEQQTGDTVTPRSDIFSLGIVLYEMITGHLPGDREYSLGHAQSVDRSTTLPAPQESRLPMPQPVLRALRKLTAADPADRPESAVDAFAEVLAALSTAGQIDDLEDRLEALEPVLVADTTPAATSLQRRDAQALLGTADIGLTDYALLNAGLDAPGLTVEQKAYMLHGAFVHNYRIDYWRYMMEAHPAERFAVYSHLLVDYDNDATARRVVEQLAAENPDTLLAHSLTPAAVGKLIGWATQGTGTLAGAVAFDVLETMVNREAASWEDDILPEEGARQLARYVLADKRHAKRAARLIGRARSATALDLLVKRAEDTVLGDPIWPVLQSIQAEAGSLPPDVPRFQLMLARLRDLLQPKKQSLRAWQRALIGGVAGALVALVMAAGMFNYANNRLRDFIYTPYTPSGIVTVVGIDDETLEAYGRWGDWSRSRHAALIERLGEMGARVVVMDVVFASSTRDDATLAKAMNGPARVVLAVTGEGAPYLAEDLLHYESQVDPAEVLGEAAAGVGHTNIMIDDDGVVREVPLYITSDEHGTQASIALAALSAYLGTDVPDYANAGVTIGARDVPFSNHATMTVNYAGPPGESYPVTSYKAVLEGDVNPAVFRDKIVLVGMMATAEPDNYPTPVSRQQPMFGVEILANSIETIWTQRFVSAPTLTARTGLIILVALATAFLPGRPWAGITSVVLLSAGYVLFTFIAFDAVRVLLDIFYPLMAIGLTYVLVTVLRYRQERKRREEVTALFEAQVTPEIASATLDAFDEGRLNLSGQVQEVSVLFADIRGYTSFSETHAPEEVMAMVNAMLGRVGQTILKHKGTIVNYEGDKIMAVFNAPLPQPAHADLALTTAKAIIADLAGYRASLPADHPYQRIGLGYGIYSGLAVVGYMGARERYEYSALGDAVNIASRLSDEADAGQILIGQAAVNRMAAPTGLTALRTITPKGRSAPLTIYTVKQAVGETDVS